MNYQFYLSVITTICFLIAVIVASYTPDEESEGRGSYSAATAVFAVTGIGCSAVLNFLLFSGRNNILERLKSR